MSTEDKRKFIKEIICDKRQRDRYCYIVVSEIKSDDDVNIIYKAIKDNIFDEKVNGFVCNYYGAYCIDNNKHEKAFYWFTKSMELNNSDGMTNLGSCYFHGINTVTDEKKAVELFQKSADMNNMFGMYRLAFCYFEGSGIDLDRKKSFEWFQKSADLGHSQSMYRLGMCYEHGEPIDRNNQKAFEMYKKSADLGNIDGTYELARCYRYGIGVATNILKAFVLFRLCHTKGHSVVHVTIRDVLSEWGPLSSSIENLMTENDNVKKENESLKEQIEHLKLYPGTDYKEAMRDFEIISKASSPQCNK